MEEKKIWPQAPEAFWGSQSGRLADIGIPKMTIVEGGLKIEFDAELKGIRLLRLPDVLAVFPVSRATWFAGVKSGAYPSPVKLAPKIVAWRWKDVKALIDSLGKSSE